MTLIATVGASDANSYLTVAEASAALAERLHTEPWLAADTANKEAALIMATRLLDEQVNWNGQRLTLTQALAWPMTGQVDQYGLFVPQTTIPPVIKRATAFYGLALLRDPSEQAGSPVLEGLVERRVGETSERYRETNRPIAALVRLPLEIRQMLRFYGAIADGTNIPLLRA